MLVDQSTILDILKYLHLRCRYPCLLLFQDLRRRMSFAVLFALQNSEARTAEVILGDTGDRSTTARQRVGLAKTNIVARSSYEPMLD
jgi:hypothetical protein